MLNKNELLEKIAKSKTATDMIDIINDVNQLAERDTCIAFCERLKEIIVSLSHEDCLLLKKSFVDPADFPIDLLVGSMASGTVKVSITRQLMVTCDDSDELGDLARNCSTFVFEQVVDTFLERCSFLKNRRATPPQDGDAAS